MLNRDQIIKEMANGEIVITPFKPENIGPNSYDVTLGSWFVKVTAKNGVPVYGEVSYVPAGKIFMFESGAFYLCHTVEAIGAKTRNVPEMKSRSSTRRMGIEICGSAGFGDIGYIYPWTMEIKNELDGDIAYQVGDRIAQISFEETDQLLSAYKGQYANFDFPISMIPKTARPNYTELYALMVEWAENYPNNSWVFSIKHDTVCKNGLGFEIKQI